MLLGRKTTEIHHNTKTSLGYWLKWTRPHRPTDREKEREMRWRDSSATPTLRRESRCPIGQWM